MKQIGQGWQYTVYDLGDGRVRKIPLSFFESYARAYYSEYSPTRRRLWSSVYEVFRIKKFTTDSIKFLKNKATLPKALLGNPQFFGGSIYEQDRCVPLEEYFAVHSREENKKIITQYVESFLTAWGCGFSEDIFNFSINNGVNKAGEIVWLDLGEILFKKEAMRTSVEQKKWLGQYSYTSLKDRDLAEFFRTEMERVITLENLETYWREN